MHTRSRQSGSVLFYIFIGIALFAALGVAVAHMMRGGQAGRPGEVSALSATTIIQYADAVRTAVRTMQVDGVASTALCFDSDSWGHANYNFAACNTPGNKVFSTSGGGVVWEQAPADATSGSTWLFTGANGIDGIGTSCANASCADLKMVLPGLKKDVCLAIDAQLKISIANGEPPIDTGYDATPFAGTYTSTATGDIGDEAGSAALSGQTQGCFKSSSLPGANTYHYYRVLIER